MIDKWTDVTIGDYLQLQEVAKIDNDADRTIGIISVLSGLSTDEVCDLPLPEFYKMKGKMSFVFTDIPLTGQMAKKYNIGGMRLRPMIEIEKMSAIQYIDYNTIIKEGDTAIVRLLSTLLVPEGKTYGNGYDIADVQTVIKDYLSIVEGMDIFHSFLFRSIDSTANGLRSLTTGMERKKAKEMRQTIRTMVDSMRDGVGFTTSIWFPQPLGEIGMESAR